MTNARDVLDLATEYHRGLPGRIRQYLYRRGIPDLLIDFHLVGWNGSRITIPIFNRQGELAFFKLARDPEDRLPGRKMRDATTTSPAIATLHTCGDVNLGEDGLEVADEIVGFLAHEHVRQLRFWDVW